MDIQPLVEKLYDKDNTVAYENLKELERLSYETGMLYGYISDFIAMMKSDRYAVRVRGIRMFSKQARWDGENIIDDNMGTALKMLNDEKPTAVRQSIAAIRGVAVYKPYIRKILKGELSVLDLMKYKESMLGLIKRDAEELISFIDKLNS